MDRIIQSSPLCLICLEHERVSSLKRRVHEKIDDYDDYRFSTLQSTVLNIFFDLAQEFDSYRDLLVICVLIPKIFFDLDCSIFLYKDKKVEHITPCVRPGKNPELFQEAPFSIHPVSHLGCYYLPIKGNKDLQAQMPIMPEDNLIGMLGIHPDHRLGDHDRLFFEKYANRLGFQLHSRMIRDNIQEHLQFIRSLNSLFCLWLRHVCCAPVVSNISYFKNG